MNAASGSVTAGTVVPDGRYVAELREASRLIAARTGDGARPWDLVFQSRSGPPSVPWLEPDVTDHLRVLAKDGVPAVVVVPVGFVSDHMEVAHDLDVEAAEIAASLGLAFARAAAPGSSERFARMAVELAAERRIGAPALALGGCGPAAGDCPADCCRYAGRPAPGRS